MPVLLRWNMIQSDFCLHWPERIYHKTNVLVRVNAQLFEALPYVLSVNRACECFVFEFLLN